MNYVCSQLSTPDAAGVQSCQVWTEQTSVLPELTKADADQILTAVALLLAVVWIGRRALRLLGG